MTGKDKYCLENTPPNPPSQGHASWRPVRHESLLRNMTENYASFIKGWKNILRKEQDRTKKLISSALENARRAAQILITEYGAREVYLFGSLTHEENFSSRSDIDLAVTGLEPSYFYDAIGRILQEIEFDLNLIPLETCKPSLRDRILKEGKLLYG